MTVKKSPADHFPHNKSKGQLPFPPLDTDIKMPESPDVIEVSSSPVRKEDDLDRAIELSLQEQEIQVSKEDQDISRVLEASLAECNGARRKRKQAWQDPLNPHERKRNATWPVGLKNIGNTCWFNSVIQSLFHLPAFRNLVLNFTSKNESATDAKEHKHLVFMKELRKLFALLIFSDCTYIDPAHLLNEFRAIFPDCSDSSQQDVSEFLHKLLELLEEAFKLNCDQTNAGAGDNLENMMAQSKLINPVIELFSGHYLSEGLHEGRKFSNEQTFGQYPLQVSGFKNIHDSIEASMSQVIESSNLQHQSLQESWFTKLPPVLLLELSRFTFNQSTMKPDKINNCLEFPKILYMDRYMKENQNLVHRIREKVRELKAEKENLSNQLLSFLNFGPHNSSVCDILKATQQFVENKGLFDVEDMEIECTSSSSINHSETLPSEMDYENCSTSNHVNHSSNTLVPCPQHVTSTELAVFKTCLERWQRETAESIESLEKKILTTQESIEKIYDDPTLLQKPYRLHAVLVHGGRAATSGHYWAHVHCSSHKLWVKFNDVTVSESNWSELEKDSLGGELFTSAYCLMYIDDNAKELLSDNLIDLSTNDLQEDLQHYILDNNSKFQREIDQWDDEHSQSKEIKVFDVLDDDDLKIADNKMPVLELTSNAPSTVTSSENSTDAPESTTPEYSESTYNRSLIMLSRLEGNKSFKTNEELLNEFVQMEIQSAKRLARMPNTQPSTNDTCLEQICVYILLNSQIPCDNALLLAILEQCTMPYMDETDLGSKIKTAAEYELKKFDFDPAGDMYSTYAHWKSMYHNFCVLVSCFIYGIDFFHITQKYESALKYFIHCCKINHELLMLPGSKRGLDQHLLEFYRRASCLKLNEIIVSEFESEDLESTSSLSKAYEYILPSMEILNEPNKEEDNNAAESIRNRWCNLLGSDYEKSKQENLQHFLGKLLDTSSNADHTHWKVPAITRKYNLEQSYKKTMQIISDAGIYKR